MPGSNLCQQGFWKMEIRSLCSNKRICRNIPQDQWKVEVRRVFENSLAQIQYNVLDAVRGRETVDGQGSIHDYDNIPQEFEGLCKMGKFISVGWRNVSVWGFVGLLVFAAGVSLASIRTEEEELWLVVGVGRMDRVLRWAIKEILRVPWANAWGFVVESLSRVPRCMGQVGDCFRSVKLRLDIMRRRWFP